MDRTPLRRAQRGMRRSVHLGQLVFGVVLAATVLIAVPTSAWLTVPLILLGAAVLTFAAWPLGRVDEESSRTRQPTPPD